MEKLQLKLNELKIDTFETGNSSAKAGTVIGHRTVESKDVCLVTDNDFTCKNNCLETLNFEICLVTERLTCGNCTNQQMLC